MPEVRPAWMAVLLLGACCAPPSPALLAELAGHDQGPERMVLEVELSTQHLSGLFDAVLIARPDPPAVRLQLLPDLGPPILDVTATPRAIRARLHGGGTVEWRGAAGDPPPGLGLLFGVTLLEQHTPLTARRVRCASGAPPRLACAGLFPGSAIEDAELADGRVVARTFRLGRIAWSDRLTAGGGEVKAPGFALRATVREREAAPDLTDADFAAEATRE